MSNPYNTDGMLMFPPNDAGPVTDNAFKSIERAIAFDVRDWSEDRRSAWIYAIVFGWDDDAWNEIAKKFGWDEHDRKRAAAFHEQWERAKPEAPEGDINRSLITGGVKMSFGDAVLAMSMKRNHGGFRDDQKKIEKIDHVIRGSAE